MKPARASEDPPATLPHLDGIARATRRFDMAAAALASAMIVVFEMGPALAKRGFKASDFEVALITSGQCLGLLCSFFITHLATRHAKSPLVFWPELISRLLLTLVFFVKPGFALGFVLIHIASHTLQQMTNPARITIYRLNYPAELRGRIVGRNRQVQLALTVILALVLSVVLDWCDGEARLVGFLGAAPVDASRMLNYLIPAFAAAGVLGSFLFRRVPVREEPPEATAPKESVFDTARRFLKVWREDREFRRFESFFVVFGFANIMSIPLTQIHAVDVLKADYFDLALINIVLMQGFMVLTLVWWGKLVDRYPPARIRGLLNVIFAVDFLMFAIAPTIEWVYAGRIFRGIAISGGSLVWMLGPLYYARSEKEVPVYLGIHSFLTGLRWLVAPFAGVWLKELCGHNARPIFWVSFAAIAATGLLMLRDKSPPDSGRGVKESTMPAPRTTGS